MTLASTFPTVYVLGNGQLGRMLKYAGMPLDINVQPLEFNAELFELEQNAVITAEIERWENTPLTRLLENHTNFVNRDIFAKLADRFLQKSLLDELDLATSAWSLVESSQQLKTLFSNINHKLVVKKRSGGYDGRGQWIIDAESTELENSELTVNTIAEAFIPFDYEISLVGARFKDGSTIFYPISHNLQQDGILRYSVVDQDFSAQAKLQQQAERMLAKIMHKLEYVGVMAMECFVVNGELLINELAPRVHNSGHWTQLGTNISQFELHLRALLNIPTSKIDIFMPSAMVNLIGIKHNIDWLQVPFTQLHWYGKQVRPGRKVGHINISHPDKQVIIESLTKLEPLLSADYKSGLNWTIKQLQA